MAYTQVTSAQLLQLLKDSWESAPFWSDSEGLVYLNHSLRVWNLLTGMWKKEVLLATPQPSSPYITLPGSLVFGMTITWGATGRALQLGSVWELDQAQQGWEGQTTATGRALNGSQVPTVPQIWAPNGLTEIVLWPADAQGLMPLLVDGVAATPVLALPTDYIDMGAQDALYIVKLALFIASFKRGAQAAQQAVPHMQEFVRAAARQNDRLKKSSWFRKFLGLDPQKGFRPIVNATMQAQQPDQGQGQIPSPQLPQKGGR